MSLEAFEPLHSARLLIRRVERGDLPGLMGVNGDEQVTRYLPYRAWASLDDANAWFDRMEGLQQGGASLQLVVIDKACGAPVGTCLLFRYDKTHGRAEIGYVLARAYWGRGYMSEALRTLIDAAFGRLDIRRLEANIDPANTASRAILQRIGFVREGRLRENYVGRNGGFSDSEIFGLLAREWRPTDEPKDRGALDTAV